MSLIWTEEDKAKKSADCGPPGLFWEFVGMVALMAMIFGLPWFFAAFNSAIGR